MSCREASSSACPSRARSSTTRRFSSATSRRGISTPTRRSGSCSCSTASIAPARRSSWSPTTARWWTRCASASSRSKTESLLATSGVGDTRPNEPCKAPALRGLVLDHRQYVDDVRRSRHRAHLDVPARPPARARNVAHLLQRPREEGRPRKGVLRAWHHAARRGGGRRSVEEGPARRPEGRRLHLEGEGLQDRV